MHKLYGLFAWMGRTCWVQEAWTSKTFDLAMSISAQLQASARAAYRSIYRAAHSTFAGEPSNLVLPPHTYRQLVGDPEIFHGMRYWCYIEIDMLKLHYY